MINKNHYLSVYKCLLFCLALGSASLISCKKNKDIPKEDPKPLTTETGLKIYKPKDMANMDWNSEESQFCYARSKQSDHYIIFWSKEYGKVNPSDASVPDKYRVDIDAMLSKAEGFYQMNVNQLKFADLSLSTSNLHKYKMMIFLYHQDDWLATGSGYDDVIGSLWVSPAACQPVGATIAHEVGHTFQYMVSVDLGLTHGFRYGYGGKGGNTFWEQCAQWQAYQSYPSEAFGGWLNGYTDNYYKHILHEDYRYSSYFIHYYWTQKHGIDFIGKLWRQSQQPEDAIQAYQRITNISQDQFNDEIYDASAKLVTWDLDALRDMGANYIGKHISKMNRQSDGSFQPDYNFCPQTTGYNVIPLNVPAAGTEVSATFKGMANASGYNKVDASIAGWRYGYVALLKDGKRVYSNVYKNPNDVAKFTIPANCDKLWMVVTGAPKIYNQHPWDEDNTNDEQWPYNVTFQNTNVYGYLNNNPGAQPTNVDFSYDVSVKQDNANYTSTPVSIELSKLTNAFALQPDELTAKMGTAIKFYAIESNGTLNATTTANGYGHWFSAAGNVVTWGPTAVVYSEYNEKNYTFTLGQYPGHNKVGDKYTVKQALVYTTSNNTTVKATFTFNITLI